MQNDTPSPFGYWQQKPALIILLALLGFVFFSGVGALLGDAVAGLYDVKVSDVLKSGGENGLNFSERQAVRWYNICAHLLGFSIASLIVVAVVRQGQSLLSYLALDKWPNTRDIGVGILITLVGLPIIQLVFWLNQQLPLPEWMTAMEEQQGWIVAEVLRMENGVELVMALLVAAVVPAIGEEVLFRGLLQPRFQQWVQNPHLGIWVTAAVFSAIHFQFAGFLPRFLLGAFLGYAFWYSGSLWLPIILHFVYNGVQVIATYLAPEDMVADAMDQTIDIASIGPLGLGSLVLVYFILRWWRTSRVDQGNYKSEV